MYKVGGPLHHLLSRLLTRQNIEQLGFVDVKEANTYLERAFCHQDQNAMRAALVVAQWIVISKSFGIPRAEPAGSVSKERRATTRHHMRVEIEGLMSWLVPLPSISHAMDWALRYVRVMY